MVKNLPAVRETWALFLGGEDSLEEEMAVTPVSLPAKSPGQRSLAAVHRAAESRTRLSN